VGGFSANFSGQRRLFPDDQNIQKRKEIQFPTRCVLRYLEYRTMDHVQTPN
jgi:hypothetical protein